MAPELEEGGTEEVDPEGELDARSFASEFVRQAERRCGVTLYLPPEE